MGDVRCVAGKKTSGVVDERSTACGARRRGIAAHTVETSK